MAHTLMPPPTAYLRPSPRSPVSLIMIGSPPSLAVTLWMTPLPPPLALGDEGDSVQQLQRALAQGGWYAGPIDGYYGTNTAKAVQAFQTEWGLVADGAANPATWQALLLSAEPQRLWVAIPSPTAETLTFHPLLVAQPDPPPSPLWLLLMALLPLLGGGLTYLKHSWQDRKR